jgi:hypothetical protein
MGKTIGDIKGEKGIGGPPLLKGSDVPKDVREVKIKCKELREAPSNFKSPAIMDLEKSVYEKEAWAVNITNLKAIATALGFAEPETAEFAAVASRAKGKIFTLTIGITNNPQTRKPARSLFIL